MPKGLATIVQVSKTTLRYACGLTYTWLYLAAKPYRILIYVGLPKVWFDVRKLYPNYTQGIDWL